MVIAPAKAAPGVVVLRWIAPAGSAETSPWFAAPGEILIFVLIAFAASVAWAFSAGDLPPAFFSDG